MDPSMKRTLYKFSRPMIENNTKNSEYNNIIHSNLSKYRYDEIKNEILCYLMQLNFKISLFEFTFIDECLDLDSYNQINIVVSIDRSTNGKIKINSFRDFLYSVGCFRNIKCENESITCLFKSYSDIVKVVFIKTNSSESAYLYYSFGITRFLERIADYLGLTMTKNGLYLNIKGDLIKTFGLKQNVSLNSIYAKILISDRIYDILEHLGIDKNKYKNEFASSDEIYNLIKESSYYKESIFQNNKEKLDEDEMTTFHLFLLDDLNSNADFVSLLKRIKNANILGAKMSPILYVKNDTDELDDL